MKLKREYFLSVTGLLNIFKKSLLFLLMFAGLTMQAQLISIVATDGDAGEVVAPGAVNEALFTVSRTIGTLAPLTVTYSIAGTATATNDYQELSGTVVFGLFNEVVINVAGIVDDDLVEDTETIIVTLTSVSQGVINAIQNTAVVLINDNDVGTISMDLTQGPNQFRPIAAEGGTTGQFVINMDKANATANPITVSFSITGTSTPGPGPGPGNDHNLTGAVDVPSMTIPYDNDGVTKGRHVNVVPFDDLVPEPDKTVIITLTGTSNPALFSIGMPNTATVTLVDDDCNGGITAPPLRSSTPTAYCDVANVNLNTFIIGGGPSAPPQRDPALEYDCKPSCKRRFDTDHGNSIRYVLWCLLGRHKRMRQPFYASGSYNVNITQRRYGGKRFGVYR